MARRDDGCRSAPTSHGVPGCHCLVARLKGDDKEEGDYFSETQRGSAVLIMDCFPVTERRTCW